MYDILFHTAVNIFKYLYLVYYYYSMYIVYLYLLLHTIYYIIPIQYLVQFIGRVGESNICTNIVYRIVTTASTITTIIVLLLLSSYLLCLASTRLCRQLL